MVTVATFTAIINQLLHEPQAGLLSGILFGTKATISNDLLDALISTGTLHIIALSGMNITIITGIVDFVFLTFLNRRLSSVLTILAIIGFVFFVGPSPSIIRASIMGTITLLSIVFGKRNWGLLTWSIAVGIMLVLNFSWLGDLSFQLSVLATLGIILFGQSSYNENRYGKLVNFWNLIKDDFRLTLSAQVFTIPILFFHFHRLSLISPLTNVLIGWTMVPVTVVGLLVSVLGWIWLPLGQVAAWIAWVFLEYIILAVELTASLPLASFHW